MKPTTHNLPYFGGKTFCHELKRQENKLAD